MRAFLVLCYVSVATAGSVGYNYQQPGFQVQGNLGTLQQPTQQVTGSSFTHSFGHQAFQTGSQVLQQQQQQYPIVTKNFYIHSAPEEQEDESFLQQLSNGPVHKHYRVVFIKAPSQSSRAAALQLAQTVNQEKTVIYVLSKKTDASELSAHLAQSQSTVSRPEVFFIKYKTPAEAEYAKQQVQAQYEQLGGSSQVSDEGIAPVSTVVGALGHQGGGLFSSVVGGSNNRGYLPPAL